MPSATWHYVPTLDNPADLASRGMLAGDFTRSKLWFNGPNWLTSTEIHWPQVSKSLSYVGPLEEKTHIHVLKPDGNSVLTELSSRHSDWNRLIRILSYILSWSRPWEASNPPASDFARSAETRWLKWLQSDMFMEELNALSSGLQVRKGSSLKTLDPFLDDDGVIRVGGRLQHASMSFEASHPVILRAHPLVRLIIRDVHRRCLHGGDGLILRTLRDTVWILQARKLIRSEIFHCIVCARMKAETAKQLMGSLPSPRVLRPERPFLHCGVDYAGPIQVRMSGGRGQRSHGAYIALFICLAVKAIHLELVSDYSTGAFIASFKRFVGRRGLPCAMYSDRGTTFHGASNELSRLLNEAICSSPFQALLARDKISWRFIPPAAPHFGGLWEAGLKQVKHHVKLVLRTHTPTFEELSTLLCEIEGFLNSRPLIPLNDSPSDMEALTPGQFLIGSSMKAIPTASHLDLSTNRLSRWQLYLQLLEKFWKDWSGDYLRSLQHRSKWSRRQENITVGQLVLFLTPISPPANWPLARVTKCIPGDDGCVRVVTVRTATSEFVRPITKIVVLPVHSAESSPTSGD